MSIAGLILFDIDGVIRDVSNSYRLAVKKTVFNFCKIEPTSVEIDNLKNEGIWNNDWDLSLELIKRYTKQNHLSITPPSRQEIIKCFEQLYFGCNPKEHHRKWNGFINNERILVDRFLFKKLREKGVEWGFVSGAELPSAKFILENKLKLNKPPLIAMGDAPDKPNPEGFLRLAKHILNNDLGFNSPPIAYVGDTVADIQTVINARNIIPTQKFISIAVAPPHLHLKSCISKRKLYESNLKRAGADVVINSTSDIRNIFLNLVSNN